MLDLRRPGSDPLSRRRLLYAVGRYAESPQRLLLEMNAAGTDYEVLADGDQDAALFTPGWDRLRALLGRATLPPTQQDILDCWGNDLPRHTANTLWRWLTRGCAAGVLVRHGDGTKFDPFRYTLAAAPAAIALGSGEPLPAAGPEAATEAVPLGAAPPPAEPRLPPVEPVPVVRSFASLAPAQAQKAPAAPPAAPPPVLSADPPSPERPEADAVKATPPARAPAPAEPAPAAAPVSDAGPEQNAAAPPPAGGSGTLPTLPPHARWLLGLFTPAPPQPEQTDEGS